MSDVGAVPSEFTGPDLMSTMISHATPTWLLETQESEHKGILHALKGLAESGVPLDDPLISMLLSEADLVSFAFWSEETQFTETATALVRGDQTYENVIKNGFWQRAWTWFRDFDLESEHQSGPDKRLAIAEIHAPHVSGCLGTFATTRAGSLDVSIKAFGLGYQRVKRVTISDSYELPQACGALTTGVQIVLHVWKHRFTDRRRALIDLIRIDGTMADEPLGPSAFHPCGQNYREVVDHAWYIGRLRGRDDEIDYRNVPMHSSSDGASTTHKMTLERGTVYSASVELPLGWFSQAGQPAPAVSKVGLSIESRVAKTVEMSWKLVSGHDYVRYRAIRGDMRMFWAWE